MANDNIDDKTIAPPIIPAAEIVRQQTEDFVSRYANYAHLQSSLWDLRISFGQVDTESGNKVPINVSVTLPWPQVKVLAYFIGVHLSAHEADNGRIRIPPGIIPPAPEQTSFRKLYEDFIAANPEAALSK